MHKTCLLSVLAILLVCDLAADPNVLGNTLAFIPLADHAEPNSTVLVVDMDRGKIHKRIPVGKAPQGTLMSAQQQRFYVSNRDSNTVTVIDTSRGQMLATIPVGNSPGEMVLDEASGRIYLTNRGDDAISVIDTVSLSTVAYVDVGSVPLGLAIDPHTRPPVHVVIGFTDDDRPFIVGNRGRNHSA